MNIHQKAEYLWRRLKAARAPMPVAEDVESVMRAVRVIGPLGPPERGLPDLAWPVWSFALAAALMALLTAFAATHAVSWSQAETLWAWWWAPEIHDLINLAPL